MKTKALNGGKPVMPGFGYEENEKKLSRFNEIYFDRLWEEQKPEKVYSERLDPEHSSKKEKTNVKSTSEKGIKFKIFVFLETLAKVPGRIISKITGPVKKHYKSNPEKAKLLRKRSKKIFRGLLILKRNFVARERSIAEAMAKMIVGIDRRNEVLAEKATKIVKRSTLKLILAREYAELNKAKLLIHLVFFLVVATIIAAGASYVSAYEYSYNGRVLGVVKNQEDVIKLLDVVTEQLTKEYNAEVKIDKKLDITFDRVISVNREIDVSEEVLKKLTYMQDMKAKAYGIYVDENREAIISSKETAKKLLNSIKARYINNAESSKYESVGFAENVEIKEVQTKLGRIQNSEDALKKILTGAVQTKVHIVGPGDTFSGVAKKYGIKSGILLESNPSVTPEKLSIGEEIVLTQAVPLITVQTVEVSTYMEPIAFEKTTENADNMYEGEKSVKVKGVIGEKKVVARIIKNNGMEISKKELKATIIEEPIKEIMLVGTKSLPSLEGSGTYIYPVVGARLSQRYSSSHRAIDLAISSGSKVRAADGGTVIYAGYSGTYGYLIRINHGGNRVTLYAHSSKLLVRAGDKVYQGQQIAYSGSTGRSTGPHVHFEVIISGVQKNPLDYI